MLPNSPATTYSINFLPRACARSGQVLTLNGGACCSGDKQPTHDKSESDETSA